MTDTFWDWHNRPVQERVAACEILQHAKFEVSNFASREDDPPDCEGQLDGLWSAIEVTRLNDEKTRKLSMKAAKANKPGFYFEWSRDDLLRKLQAQIDDKEDDVKRYSGGPYQRYVLVFHTDEVFLDRGTTERFLKDATFRARLFTDIVVGVSPDGEGYPTFRLQLQRG